ncbi:hypothetical protein CEG14_21325 [Bordetella genomosp. 1]|uniref:Sce7726 family protein n=1 Tax=Bordetella genomosp. 1 TaxID=1395607 RepID=A0A261RWY3_9BORD|nr:sce7726 family protein [Bordetella genomosp. 1]OZI29172.1 hypothetical protein CEG14_21325 [Bordetella genomosp. 1]
MERPLNEADLRRLLCRHIRRSNGSRSDAFIPEYFVEHASRRADLVVAGAALAAFEIKSDLDTLRRLDDQIAVFCRYFEVVTVVCTARHADKVLASTPERVGVLCLGSATVQTLRAAAPAQTVSVSDWLSHLPLKQIQPMLRARQVVVPCASRAALEEIAARELTPEQIRAGVLRYLKTVKCAQRRSAGRERTRTRGLPDPYEAHAKMMRDFLASPMAASAPL